MKFNNMITKKNLINLLVLFILFFSFSAFAQEREEIRNFLALSGENPFLPVVLLVGIAIAGFAFFFPRFGLVVMLLFVLVSTDMQVADAGGRGYGHRAIAIRMEDVVLILVSGGWLLNRAKTRSLSEFRHVPINKPIIMMSFVLVMAFLIGYLQGTTPFTRGILFTMKRLEYFWIFFMTLNIMKSDREVQLSTNILMIVTVFVALIGAVQFFLFPLSGLTGGGATATSGFGRANTLADFYLIVGGVFLGLFIYSVNRWKTWAYLSVMALCATAIIMTKSRGAYVSVPPLIVTILLITKNKKIFFSILVAVMLVIFYLVGMAVIRSGQGIIAQGAEQLTQKHTGDIGNQFESISDIAQDGAEADSSFNARVTSWKNAIPEIVSYPLIGHGVGAKPLAAFDCQYVRELYETGLIGLLFLLYLNFIIFVTIFNFFHMTDNSFTKGICCGFLGGQVGMLVHGWSLANFYTIMNMEIFWFIIALIMILYHNHMTREQEKENETTLDESLEQMEMRL